MFEEFPRFDEKLKVLEERKIGLRGKGEILQDDYRRYKKYFEEAFLSYTDKVEREAKNIQEIIASREEQNNQRLHELEVLRDSIYDEMETKTQLSLIRQATSLAESIEALTSQ